MRSQKMRKAAKRLRRTAQNEKKRLRQQARRQRQRDTNKRLALRRHRRNARLRTVFGAALFLCTLFVLFALALDYCSHPEKPRQYQTLFLVVLLAVGGLHSLRKGVQGLRLQHLYPAYRQALEEPGTNTLTLFATRLGQEGRIKRLQKPLLAMLEAGFFPGYSLNLKQKTIHSPSAPQEEIPQWSDSDMVYVRIPCPRCQASNLVREDAVERCYCCGAAL